MAQITAYCFASGEIGFGEKMPAGALPIIKGEAAHVRTLMCATARHSYDGKTLLVPGVPEAPNQEAGVDALLAFRDWLAERETAAKDRTATP